MLPVLFSIGNISLTSFSVFLAIGIFFGMMLVWRLARAWDLNEEKTLDLILLTFLGGVIGARLYFAVANLPLFIDNPLDLFFPGKIPGFSFWGAFLGGWLSLYFFSRRLKLDFLHIVDIAIVGLLGGLIFSDIGCFLGGCYIGAASKAPFAVNMVGFVGKRWPIQIAEALLLVLVLLKIWSKATHFHLRGKIASLGLIYIGAIKLILEPFKQDHQQIFFPIILIFLGLFIFYKVTKQNPLRQFKAFVSIFVGIITSPKVRKEVVQKVIKSCYNQSVAISWRIRNFKKTLRRLNVRFSRKNT